jgi:hypothetical protein
MAKLSRELASTTLHPREDIFATAALASVNAETIISADGCTTLTLDLRGTFSLTIEVNGTVDGTNWQLIPMRPVNQAAKLWVAAVTGTTAGTWVGTIAGYRQVRARVTAYTSGSCTTTLLASLSPTASEQEMITPTLVTSVGAAAAAVTLTLPAPGAGLRQYITYLTINRFATALLTAAATPVTVTTTNLPGSLAFSFAADAAALGTIDRWREDFAYPLASSAQNTATTIVAPATTAVIWRVTAGYYIAP